jgi:hypothetical protein
MTNAYVLEENNKTTNWKKETQTVDKEVLDRNMRF